jgi:hypothetical protein
VILAVGEAACVETLELAASLAPFAARVSLLPPRREPGGLSDLVLPRASPDAALEIERRFLRPPPPDDRPPGPLCVLRFGRGGGVSRANAALRRARGPRVLFLDGRVDVGPEGLGRMEGMLREDPWAAAVAAQRAPEPLSRESRRLEALRFLASSGMRVEGSLPGFCWLARRSHMDRAGFLDERFRTPRFAVQDYFLRLRQAGFRVCSQDGLAVPEGARAREDPRLEARDLRLLWDKWCLGLGEAMREACGRG